MLAEWQNEYGSDHLILMRGRGGGREDVFGSGVVSSATRSCLSIRLLYKMYYSVYRCLGYFFLAKTDHGIFFSPKIFTPTPIKIKWSLSKKTEKVSKMSRVNDTVSRMSRIRRFQGSFYKEILAAA